MTNLREQFGDIDIYLFDQLLRGRIRPGMRVLDAGCGSGRNVAYLLREGYDVLAVDADARRVGEVRRLAAAVAPALPADNFRAEPIDGMSVPDASVDVVICCAVLHFARDDDHFSAMLRGVWRTLRPGGLFFSRLASTTGIEHAVRTTAGRRGLLPDGTERYLVDDAMLLGLTEKLGGELLDPLKTTVVSGMRSMTTWVMRAK